VTQKRYHAGRMILDQLQGIWHLRIRLGSTQEQQHKACLETSDLMEAVFRAERIYADMRRKLGKKADDKPMCWQCIHWEPVKAACYFGWPEARQTGGRFAAQCSVFKACPTRK
jgi:hypothetical protein